MAERSNLIKVSDFDPSTLEKEIIKAAVAAESIESLHELLSFEYDLDLPRPQLRQLVQYAKREEELDALADAPSAPSVLTEKIDKALELEIDRIMEENTVLRKIARAQDDKRFQLDDTGEVISPQAARARLASNTDMLLAIKKLSTEQAKASGEHGNAGFNLTVDLGGMVSSAIRNIKASEIDSSIEIVQ